MTIQAVSSNDLFYGLGIEFYSEPFASTIAETAAIEIQDFFKLKNINPKEKLKRRTYAWLYFKEHHLLSLIKKPGAMSQLKFYFISKINGFKI